MKSTKKILRILAIVLVLLYAGAHLCIRIGFVQRQVLDSFSRRAGYTVEASKIRFTAGLSWTLRDVRVSYLDQGETNTVFTAPVVTLRTGCGGFASVPRGASFFARRSGGPTGVWTPSQAQTFGQECCAVEAFRKAGPLFGAFAFDVVDASIFVTDEEGKETVFAGVSWSRLPANLPGFPGAIEATLSYQRASGLAIAAPETLPATQWLELGGRLVDLQERPVPPPPAVRPDAGATGVAPSEPPSKQDMVEAFREFFQTDPETAKAFFKEAGKAVEEAQPHAEPAPAPAPEPAPAADPAPAPAPEANPAASEPEENKPAPAAAEPAPAAAAPAPVPETTHAEPAENAESPAPAAVDPAPQTAN